MTHSVHWRSINESTSLGVDVPYIQDDQTGLILEPEDIVGVLDSTEYQVGKFLRQVVRQAKDPRHTFTLQDRYIKLAEEFGELGEALLFHTGKAPHKAKKIKEPLQGEVADTIIQAVDVLVGAFPDASEDDIMKLLALWLSTKLLKWDAVMEEKAKLARESVL